MARHPNGPSHRSLTSANSARALAKSASAPTTLIAQIALYIATIPLKVLHHRSALYLATLAALAALAARLHGPALAARLHGPALAVRPQPKPSPAIKKARTANHALALAPSAVLPDPTLTATSQHRCQKLKDATNLALAAVRPQLPRPPGLQTHVKHNTAPEASFAAKMVATILAMVIFAAAVMAVRSIFSSFFGELAKFAIADLVFSLRLLSSRHSVRP
jgi:hypothetical protein